MNQDQSQVKQPKSADSMIRVLTFNIRYGQADDGINQWERRQALVIDRIRAADPDLIGLQECRDDEQAEVVRRALSDYEFYGVTRGGDGTTALEMAPVLARRAVFQPVRQGCFWLSPTPDIAGSVGWDAMFPRTVTWAELVHQPTGRPLVFLNTHFDLMPEAILNSAGLLRDWAERTASRLPVIVTGDFNADKSSAAYQLLAGGQALRDTWRQARAPGDDDTTFHAFGQPGVAVAIDWVLVSPVFRVLDVAVDRFHDGDRYPSDHYPLLATLHWPAGLTHPPLNAVLTPS